MKKENARSGKDTEQYDRYRFLLLYILIGIMLGVVVGGFFPTVGKAFGVVGEVFLNLLMMLVVPLVVLSMIVGITSLGNIANLGSIGWRTIVFYLITTSLSVFVGVIAVNLVQPGKGISPGEKHPEMTYRINPENRHQLFIDNTRWDRTNYSDKYVIILSDQEIRGAIDSFGEQSVTVRFWKKQTPEEALYIEAEDGTQLPFYLRQGEYVAREPEIQFSGQGIEIALSAASALDQQAQGNLLSTLKEVVIGNKEKGTQGMIPRNIFKAMVEMDMLPLIFFALLLGMALSMLGEQARGTITVITTLNEAVMLLVHWIMYVAPLGIFGLLAARIGEAGGFSGFLPELSALGKYALTVVGGLLFHSLITLPLILWFFARRNPWRYAVGVGAALLNAFSTASSSATLPLTIQGTEEENGVSGRTAGFVLPLGATINMDGTALYESVAAIFIAQVYGISLGLGEQIIIFFTATLAAIGAAGIPQAGLVTMVIVLKAVGLPLDGVGLILTIDWLLDRFRTTVNVWGDSVGAGVIDRYEQA